MASTQGTQSGIALSESDRSALMASLIAQLSDSIYLGKLKAEVDDMVVFNRIPEAAALLADLKFYISLFPNFALTWPEQYRLLNAILTVLKWIVFHTLSDDDAIGMIEHHLLQAVRVEDYDLWGRVRLWLLRYPIFEERDQCKIEFRGAMERNQERLSVIVPGVVPVPHTGTPNAGGTVGAWVKYFSSSVGRTPVDTIKINSFLGRDEYARKLGQAEQDHLRRVLELYEHLLRMTATLDGIEEILTVEDDDGKGIFTEGRFEPINEIEEVRINRALNDMRGLIISTLGDELPEMLLKNMGVQEKDLLVGRLVKKYGVWSSAPGISETLSMVGKKNNRISAAEHSEKFFAAINSKETESVLYHLWSLAQIGEVRKTLGQSDRYVRYWEHQIEKSKIIEIDEFLKDPAAQKHILAFLKHVLIERLKMSEESAKLAALTFSNEARKAGEVEYAKLAYGDLESGEFKWMSESS